jgi:hypothetical protein
MAWKSCRLAVDGVSITALRHRWSRAFSCAIECGNVTPHNSGRRLILLAIYLIAIAVTLLAYGKEWWRISLRGILITMTVAALVIGLASCIGRLMR